MGGGRSFVPSSYIVYIIRSTLVILQSSRTPRSHKQTLNLDPSVQFRHHKQKRGRSEKWRDKDGSKQEKCTAPCGNYGDGYRLAPEGRAEKKNKKNKERRKEGGQGRERGEAPSFYPC